MMKKEVFVCCLFIFLAGCKTSSVPQEGWIAAYPVVENPGLVEIKKSEVNYRLASGNDPMLEDAFKQYLKTGSAPTVHTEGFVKFAYHREQQPLIQTAPFQETVISLEPSEKYTNITTGDPNRWSYAVATSGSGQLQQQHILIKPSQAQMSTNMVITTNKRLYNVRLISSEHKPTKSVSFWYPEDMINKANQLALKEEEDAPIAKFPNLQVHHLNFDYQISNGNLNGVPAWKPIRVFDDGQHTYIQFPHYVANGDLPVLFVIDKNKEKSLVNYRAKPPYFVVDKIFKEAVLVVGVGRKQETVSLTNVRYG